MKNAALLLAPLAIALGACAGTTASTATVTTSAVSSEASTFVLAGVVTLSGYDSFTSLTGKGSLCWGIDGYDDLAEGAKVVVSDEAGTVLATDAVQSATAMGGYRCDLMFRVAVPDGQAFYQVSVGNRDPYVASADEARRGLALSIG